MAKKRFDQVETVELASGTAAGLHEKEFTLDSTYPKGTGVRVHVLENKSIDFNIGFKNQTGQLQNPTHKDDYISSTSTAPNCRIKELDYKAGGMRIVVQTDLSAALTADLKYQVVFTLEREEAICE